jgi:phenylacetic acid degradation operon negative regulatory protein
MLTLYFGPLSEATWISPHNLVREVEEVAERLNIRDYVQIFQATHNGFTDAKKIVSRCWDLNETHHKYAEFIAKYKPKLEDHIKRLKDGKTIEPSDCFVERFNLVHEYRKLPYFDPDLPEDLLPRSWLRSKAADLFQQYHDLLTEKANEYFNSVSKSYRGARRAKAERIKGTDRRPYRGGNSFSGSFREREQNRVLLGQI